MRKTHIEWAEYFEKYPNIEKEYIATKVWDSAETHRDIIRQYDNVLNILKYRRSKIMKYVYEIKTPEGTGSIAIGEFMPKDGRRGKFHCWWNGCGIGGDSKNLEDAKKYLKKYIIEHLTRRLEGYEKYCFDIKLFLHNWKE